MRIIKLSNTVLQENTNANMVRIVNLHNQLDDKNLCLTEKSNKYILVINSLKESLKLSK